MLRHTIIAALAVAIAVSAFAQEKKPSVLVCDFETGDGANAYLSVSTALMLMTALTYVGDYKIVSEEKQAKLMESIGKNTGENISTAEAVETASAAGAKYVITGRISKSDKDYTITINIIDAASGDVIETRSSKHKYERNISKSIDDIVGLTE